MMSNLKVLWMQIKESIIFVSLIPHYFLGKYISSNASYFFLLVLQSPSNSRGIRFQALHIMIKYDKKSHKYNYASWGSSSTWKMLFDNFKSYRIWIEELYWITRYWRIIELMNNWNQFDIHDAIQRTCTHHSSTM